MNSFSADGGRICLHVMSQKSALSYALRYLLLFTHSDVPYRFNGKKDNILLDNLLTPIPLMLFTGINSMHRGNLLRILCRCCTLKLPQGAFSKLRFHLSVLNTDA